MGKATITFSDVEDEPGRWVSTIDYDPPLEPGDEEGTVKGSVAQVEAVKLYRYLVEEQSPEATPTAESNGAQG